jgi:outer membrane protein assembly factor BamB
MKSSRKRIAVASFVVAIIFASLFVIRPTEAAVPTFYLWTTSQADAQRTGFTESPSPSSNQTFWTFQTGGPITSSPAVAAGMVFVGSSDGYLYAVNATTGAKVWSSWVGTSAGSPTLTNGRIFVASSGTVYAFDMATGTSVWTQSLTEETRIGAPLVVGSRLFVGGTRTVFAFNEAFGVRLYSETIPHVNGIKRLTYTDGIVVAFSSINGSGIGLGLHGFEAVNTIGRFWVYLEPTGKDRYSNFIKDEDATVFAIVQGSEGNSSAFGVTRMGLMLWEHQLSGSTEAFLATAYDKAYVPTNKFVYALNVTDGSVQWSRPTNGASVSSPGVADGKVYFGLDDGSVYALDAFDGDLIWSYKTGGSVQSSPAVSDGLLFVGSNDGKLYAIGYPKIQTFNAGTWNGTTYEVSIQSNVAVSDFTFNQSSNQVSFNIVPSEAVGFCNVTFPSSLLNGSYSVIAGENQSLSFEEETNASHTVLSFNLPQGFSSVRIEGAEAIPEFPLWAPMLVALGVLIGVMIMLMKRVPQKNSDQRRESQ